MIEEEPAGAPIAMAPEGAPMEAPPVIGPGPAMGGASVVRIEEPPIVALGGDDSAIIAPSDDAGD